MNIIYNIIDIVFPFSFMQYDFMKNALLALIVIAPLFGIIGTMIVENKMSFFSDALGHSALAGIAIGTLIGITNYSVSMIIFGIVFAVLLNYIKNKKTASTDTIISVFSSFAVAVGLIILSKIGGISKYTEYLVGDILSVTLKEIAMLFVILILTLILWLKLCNKLVLTSINSTLAKSRGINVRIIENIFGILIAIIVMLTVKWVGILLINALLILPAAASRNIASNMREYTLYSILISLLSGFLGLVLSFSFSYATGPMIVAISAIIYFVTFIFRKR